MNVVVYLLGVDAGAASIVGLSNLPTAPQDTSTRRLLQTESMNVCGSVS